LALEGDERKDDQRLAQTLCAQRKEM
jgi:hypothetical protein